MGREDTETAIECFHKFIICFFAGLILHTDHASGQYFCFCLIDDMMI